MAEKNIDFAKARVVLNVKVTKKHIEALATLLDESGYNPTVHGAYMFLEACGGKLPDDAILTWKGVALHLPKIVTVKP
jgi:hypothetical protein